MLARLGSATFIQLLDIFIRPEAVLFELGMHLQLAQMWFDAVTQILVSSFIFYAVAYPASRIVWPPAATPDGCWSPVSPVADLPAPFMCLRYPKTSQMALNHSVSATGSQD